MRGARLRPATDLPFRGFLGLWGLVATTFTTVVATAPHAAEDPRPLTAAEEAVVLQVMLPMALPAAAVAPVPVPPAPAERPRRVRSSSRSADTGAARDDVPTARPPRAQTSREKADALLLALLGSKDGRADLAPVEDLLATPGLDRATAEALARVGSARTETAGLEMNLRGPGRPNGSEDAVVELYRLEGGTARLGDGTGVGPVREGTPPEPGNRPPCEAAAVRRVVQDANGAFQGCFERELKQHPSLDGRVEVRWSILDGRPVQVRIVSNSTGNASLGACVSGRIEALRFPDCRVSTDVSYPFIFSVR